MARVDPDIPKEVMVFHITVTQVNYYTFKKYPVSKNFGWGKSYVTH
jgi:hypothetical protein